MTAIREALQRAMKRADDEASYRVYYEAKAALAELEALEAVAETALATMDAAPGLMSDTPFAHRLNDQHAALARLAAVQDGLPNECDEACRRHQPDCDGECRHLPGHVNECNQKRARARRATVQDGQTPRRITFSDYTPPTESSAVIDGKLVPLDDVAIDAIARACPCRVHGDPDGDCGERCG